MITAPESRAARATLLTIVAVAAALRFWSLNAGNPYSIGIDEPQVLNRSLQMMHSGNFHPRFFDYPTFYIYLQLIVACVRFMTGALQGYWSSLSEPSLPDYLLWARAVTASLGTLTVVLVYRIGLRWSVRHALVAAGLMAVMSLHVRESHYVLTDVPVTFLVTLTFLLTLRATENASIWPFVYAGITAGLGAATKYPGALALMLPIVAAWMTREARPSRLSVVAATVIAAGVAFLIAAPYTVLDLPGFLDGFGRLMVSYTGRAAEAPWRTYLKHLRRSMQWPAFVASLVGCVIAFSRATTGPSRTRWVLLLLFPLMYFGFISRQTLVFGRYLLPLVPFLCLLVAAALVATAAELSRLLGRRQIRAAAVAVLMIVVTAPPAVTSVRFVAQLSRRSTASFAYEWIMRNVPHGTSFVVEGSDLSLMFGPYKVIHVPHLRVRTYDQYLESGIEYLVASSQLYGSYLERPDLFPNESAQYASMFQRGEEVARFTPDNHRPGPELRIIRIKH